MSKKLVVFLSDRSSIGDNLVRSRRNRKNDDQSAFKRKKEKEWKGWNSRVSVRVYMVEVFNRRFIIVIGLSLRYLTGE